MRRINLLPDDERRRGTTLQAPGGILGILLISGAAVLLIMVGLYVFYLLRLNNQEEEIARLDQQIAEQNQRIEELSPFQDLQTRLDTIKPIADGIFRTRFIWDEFLQGLTFVVPPNTTLDTMDAQASPVNIQAPVDQRLSPPGAVTFTGLALPEYENISDLVVRLNTLPYLANSQINSAELDRETFSQPAITFEVASELLTVAGEQGEELRIENAAPDDPNAASDAIELPPNENAANRSGNAAGQYGSQGLQYGAVP